MSFHYTEKSWIARTVASCEAVLERGERRLKAEAANFSKARAEMKDAIKRTVEAVKPAQSLYKSNRKEYNRKKRALLKQREAFTANYKKGLSVSECCKLVGCTLSLGMYWSSKSGILDAHLEANRHLIEFAAMHGVPSQMIDFEHGWKKCTAFYLARRLEIHLERIDQARDIELKAANRAAQEAGYKCRAERLGSAGSKAKDSYRIYVPESAKLAA